MSWIAEYDTQGREFPTCVHVTKTTGTMTHGATYVPIEDGKAVRAENDKLRASNEVIAEDHAALCEQNAKLRELCKMFAEYVSKDRCEGCVVKCRCNDGEVEECWQRTEIRKVARELRIEVDE